MAEPVTLDQIGKLFDQKLSERLNPIMDNLHDLNKKVLDALESLTFLNADCESLKISVESLKNRNEALTSENRILNKQVSELTKDLQAVSKGIDDLEQYSRRDCLEVKGIPHLQDENTTDLVIKVGQLMGINMQATDISVSHRLPAPSPRLQQPPKPGVHVNIPTPSIIVKFTRRRDRDQFYASRKHVKNKTVADLGLGRHSDNYIYISESLSPRNRELFKACLGFKHDYNFAFIWTHAGRTYLRKNQDSPALAITSLVKLDNLINRVRASRNEMDGRSEESFEVDNND